MRHSGILDEFPEIRLSENKVGIFGKLAKLSATLRDGDRIEIYRALIADPKEVRRQRAAEGKRMKKGGGSLSPDDGASTILARASLWKYNIICCRAVSRRELSAM